MSDKEFVNWDMERKTIEEAGFEHTGNEKMNYRIMVLD